jgi:hypothetical protein
VGDLNRRSPREWVPVEREQAMVAVPGKHFVEPLGVELELA